MEGVRRSSHLPARLATGLVLGLLILYTGWKEGRPEFGRIISSDAKGYYVYLTGVFIDGFRDSSWLIPGAIRLHPETGLVLTKYTYGTALMEAPAFLAGHAVASIGPAPADGRSLPYRIALLFSAALFMAGGLVLAAGPVAARHGPRVAAATMVALALGTSLYYYSAIEPAYSHVYSFFLIACFVRLLPGVLREPAWRRVALLALVTGLIAAVRLPNLAILLLVPVWGVTSWRGLVERIRWMFRHAARLSVVPPAVVLAYMPQFVYWHHVTGSWAFQAYPGEGFAYWAEPRMLAVLFSVRNGLFIYAPVLLFALAGMGIAWRRKTPESRAVPVLFLALTYLFGSWWAWWFGGAFGHRAYVDFLAVLAFPLGTCFAALGRAAKGWRYATAVLFTAFVLYTAGMARIYDPPWDGPQWGWDDWWKRVERVLPG